MCSVRIISYSRRYYSLSSEGVDPADDGCLGPRRSAPSAWAFLFARRAWMDVPARPGRLWRAARYTTCCSRVRAERIRTRCAGGAPVINKCGFRCASAHAVTFFRQWISNFRLSVYSNRDFSRPFAFRPGIFGLIARGSNLASIVPGKIRGVAGPGRPPRFDQEGFCAVAAALGRATAWGRPPSRRVRLARAATHGPRSSERIPRARRFTTGARRAWIPTRGAKRERARARRTRSVAASLGGVRARCWALGISDG